jgi:hypothetical protein
VCLCVCVSLCVSVWQPQVEKYLDHLEPLPNKVYQGSYCEESIETFFTHLLKVRFETLCPGCLRYNSFPETWDGAKSFHCRRCKTSYQTDERQQLENRATSVIAYLDGRNAPSTHVREEKQVARGVKV